MSEYIEIYKWIGWAVSAGLIILSIPMLAHRYLLCKKRERIRSCIDVLLLDAYRMEWCLIPPLDKCKHFITSGPPDYDEDENSNITLFYVNLREWKI